MPKGRFGRYIVLRFETYYPLGGMNDAIDSYDFLDGAMNFVQQSSADNLQVFDCVTRMVVYEGRGGNRFTD